MNSAKGTIIIAMLSCAFFTPVCAGRESGSEAKGLRVIEFPEDYSAGAVRLCARPGVSGGPQRRIQAIGKIEVPADKVVEFEPYKIAWHSGWRFSTLKPDDIRTILLGWYKDADGSVLKDIGRLSGLEGLGFPSCDGIETGLEHLAGLKKLTFLSIPGHLKGEELAHLTKLPSLDWLAFGGPMVTDEKMVHIGKLTQLTKLSLRGSEVAEGLVHLKELESLRFLDLRGNRSHDIDDGLRHIAGLTELEELNLRATAVGDAGLAHLSGLTKLRKLNLMMTTGITDAGMAHLKGLKSLEELTFPQSPIGDIGLAHLAELDSLKHMYDFNAEVTDRDLAALAGMKSLESLEITIGRNVTDAGLAEFCRCARLKSLGISGTELTDARLAKLAEMKTLRHLGIYGTSMTGICSGEFKSLDTLTLDSTSNVTGVGLASLRKLSSLEGLEFRNVNPGKTGTSYLTGLTSLRSLNIWVSPDDMTFGDDDLAHLADLTSLRCIRITVGKDWSTITDRGLAHLSNLKALEDLTLGPCPKVTDAGLKHLERLSRLNDLTLYKSRITMAGVDRLKEKIPEVVVTAPCTMDDWRRKLKAIEAGQPFGARRDSAK